MAPLRLAQIAGLFRLLLLLPPVLLDALLQALLLFLLALSLLLIALPLLLLLPLSTLVVGVGLPLQPLHQREPGLLHACGATLGATQLAAGLVLQHLPGGGALLPAQLPVDLLVRLLDARVLSLALFICSPEAEALALLPLRRALRLLYRLLFLRLRRWHIQAAVPLVRAEAVRRCTGHLHGWRALDAVCLLRPLTGTLGLDQGGPLLQRGRALPGVAVGLAPRVRLLLLKLIEVETHGVRKPGSVSGTQK
mmetsp:Transcript_67260/g.217090  ORF Transcript_67260/g.217090 Transcript_67260/m.217090 type:complete len:251 (+) Transcript_67260:1069-1821(+)